MSEPVPSTSSSSAAQSTSPNNKRVQKYNAQDYILSKDCLASLKSVINSKFGINSYEINSDFLSVTGENSYGAVVQLEIIPKKVTKSTIEPIPSTSTSIGLDNVSLTKKKLSLSPSSKQLSPSLKQSSPDKRKYLLVKLSPKHAARRKAMKVVDYYKREVFIYRQVLPHYKEIQLNYNNDNSNNNNNNNNNDIENNIQNNLQFKSAPIFYDSSLKKLDEFLILEDLTQKGYSRFSRHKPLTYHHCSLALIELAKFHSMSFILRHKNRNLYYSLVDQIRYDNLFTDDIEPVSIQFAIKYINKTFDLVKNEDSNLFMSKRYILNKIYHISEIFHELCVELVDGDITDPYSVICHGDFWNNNILYKYDSETGLPIEAKVIDFQMARFSTPVLDFVHYLFTCTEKTLRDEHFLQFKNVYYNALADELKLNHLEPSLIFPRSIFERHLKSHGIYGFCMAVYAMPFFISDGSDIPDFDEVSQAILELNGYVKSPDTSRDSNNSICSNNNKSNHDDDDDKDEVDDDDEDNNNDNNSTSKSSALKNDNNNTDIDSNGDENDNKTDKNSKSKSKNNNFIAENKPLAELLASYEMLNPRTDPIYCARMLGIVRDLEKYDLFDHIPMLKTNQRKKRS